MDIQYNVSEINESLSAICEITGMTLGFWNNRQELIAVQPEWHNPFCYAIRQTKEGARRCACSDGLMLEKCLREQSRVTHICHAGLPDSIMPLYYEGILIGFLSFGQISDEQIRLPDEEIRRRLADLPLDVETMIEAYHRLPRYSAKKIQAVTQIATACMQFVFVKKNLFRLGNPEIEQIVEWIRAHLAAPISYRDICEEWYISPSTLYALFRKTYRCTVHQYIRQLRLEKARELLRSSTLSVGAVGDAVGFPSQNYFARLFREEYGVSPTAYRRQGEQGFTVEKD